MYAAFTFFTSLCSKLFPIVDAGLNVTAVALDKERTRADIINACAQGAFIMAQGGNVYARNQCLSKDAQLNFALVSAGTDGIRTVTEVYAKIQKGDVKEDIQKFTLVKTAGKVCMHVADFVNIYSQDGCQELRDRCREIASDAMFISNTIALGATVYTLRISASAAKEALKCYWETRGANELELRNRIIGIMAPNATQANVPTRPRIPIQVKDYEAELMKLFASCQAALGLDSKEEDPKNKIHMKDFIDSIQAIPTFLFPLNDPTWCWRCSITQKNIRFVVVPNFSEEMRNNRNDIDVMYEKMEFEKWTKEHPGECPPKWPKDLWPLKEPCVIIDHSAQRSIYWLLKENIERLALEYKKSLRGNANANKAIV